MVKKRKKKRKIKLKIKNILIFLVILLLIVLVIFYCLNMPVKNIYISGNNILSDEVILNDSKLVDYPSFLLTSSFEIEHNLKKNKYIEKIKVSKKFGNIIELKITEYKPLVILEKENQIIMSNGSILDNTYNLADTPILINAIPEEIFSNFVDKFSKIDMNILRQISQIEYEATNVDDSRFLLYMNDGNIVYVTLTKINKLNKYNSIKDKMNNQTGIIYLDSGDYIELKDNRVKK